MRAFVQDVRYGIRSALRQPGYTLLVVLTLALAIGANTVTFSFTNVLLVRPLPVRDQSTLVWVFMVNSQQGTSRGFMSVPDLLDLRTSLRSIENLGGSTPGAATMTGRGEAQPLTTSRVTANMLDMWGAKMAAGRSFAAGDDAPGAAPVALLSHRFWQRRFDGDATIWTNRRFLTNPKPLPDDGPIVAYRKWGERFWPPEYLPDAGPGPAAAPPARAAATVSAPN